MATFRLLRFAEGTEGHALAIEGAVWREGGVMHASYRVTGTEEGLVDLVIAPVAEAPARRDGLWQSTCVELFVAPRGRAGYLEVNLSPSRHWNVYRFAGYRDGATALAPVVLATHRDATEAKSPSGLALRMTLELPADVAGEPLDVGVSAVLEHPGARKSYWALAHPGERPDFHRRDAFVLAL